ncbi:uncharacterized protein LOC105827761 isoform X1 [Monomorium pharaonis]|uniref:uncharacterized protein LOC105827761 isoform X1 n=1 Tax=Monomorium pharaonis TaxID=307658 RepID=UPI00063EF9A2|nr:uncharacterized protein LOC105827761 isoform X1 [Monomorium pharaonis]
MTDQAMAQGEVKLTEEQLNQITRDIHYTLTHSEGNKLYARFLEHNAAVYPNCPELLKCLETYNTCSKYLNKEQNQSVEGNLSTDSLEFLFTKVEEIKKTVKNIDVSEIDLDLMTKFEIALKEKKTKEALLTVLDETKTRCQHALSGEIYRHFTNYIISRNYSS